MHTKPKFIITIRQRSDRNMPYFPDEKDIEVTSVDNIQAATEKVFRSFPDWFVIDSREVRS